MRDTVELLGTAVLLLVFLIFLDSCAKKTSAATPMPPKVAPACTDLGFKQWQWPDGFTRLTRVHDCLFYRQHCYLLQDYFTGVRQTYCFRREDR